MSGKRTLRPSILRLGQHDVASTLTRVPLLNASLTPPDKSKRTQYHSTRALFNEFEARLPCQANLFLF